MKIKSSSFINPVKQKKVAARLRLHLAHGEIKLFPPLAVELTEEAVLAARGGALFNIPYRVSPGLSAALARRARNEMKQPGEGEIGAICRSGEQHQQPDQNGLHDC